MKKEELKQNLNDVAEMNDEQLESVNGGSAGIKVDSNTVVYVNEVTGKPVTLKEQMEELSKPVPVTVPYIGFQNPNKN